MTDVYRNDAFISYRRSDGQRVARRLRRRLLDYKLLENFRSPSTPTQLTIYLDTLYERATQDFFDNTIKPALAASRHLIIVQSPDALRPRADGQENWVAREVRYFQSLPQGKNMAVAVAEGNLDAPLPAELGQQFPNIECVDMRPLGRLIPRRVDDQLLTFIATLYDIPSDRMPELRREEELQQLQRLRLRAMVLGVALLIVVGLLAWALVSRQQARIARALAEARLQTATSLRLAAESKTQGIHRTDLALLLAAQAFDIRPTIEAQSALLAGFDRSPRLAAYLHCTSFARAVAFAPSGTSLAIACDKEVTFWDVERRAMSGPSWKIEGEQINALRFDPSGQVLAASGSNALRVYDLQSHRAWEHPAHSAPIRDLAFSHNGKFLASVDWEGAVFLWTTKSLTASGPVDSALFSNPAAKTAALAFSPDDHLLALAGDDGSIHLYAVPDGTEAGILCCHGNGVSDVEFINTKTVLSSSVDGTIRQWNLENISNSSLATDAARRYATKLALSGDAQRFAYVTEQNVIKVGSLDTGAFEEFKGHTHNVFDLTFDTFSGQSLLASAGEITPTSPDGPAEYGVLLWEVARPHPLATRLERYSGAPVILRFVPGRSEFVCAGCGGGVELWQWEGSSARRITHTDLPGMFPSAVAISPDGTTLLVGTTEGVLYLFDFPTLTPRGQVKIHDGTVLDLVSMKDQRVWSVGVDGVVTSRDSLRLTSENSYRLTEKGKMACAAIDSVHRQVVWRDYAGGLFLWSLDTHTPEGNRQVVEGTCSHAMMTTGGQVGVLIEERGLQLLDRQDPTLLLSRLASPIIDESGLPNPIQAVALDREGKTLISGGSFTDRVVVWNIETRRPVGFLHSGQRVRGLAVNDSGTTLITVSDEEGMLLWNLDPTAWARIARRVANRQFTEGERRTFIGQSASSEPSSLTVLWRDFLQKIFGVE